MAVGEPVPSAAPRGLDRAGDERLREGLIESLRADPRTAVLVVAGDAAPLVAPGRILWVSPQDVPDDAWWAFLGRDEEGRGALLAAMPSADEPFAAPAGWGSLRAVGGALDDGDADALVTGVSLSRWLVDSPFCPACGSRTEQRTAGWARHCPTCGREHFPRTDPAVIVAITRDDDPDLVLLGANAMWKGAMYSCFAGFCEAGESLEETLVREIREEAGVEVVDVRYRGSQAWPYPRSLMVGFHATATGIARPDGEEIIDVRWFHRDEIGAALRGEGDVRLPGPASIARRLIVEWYESR